MADEAGSIELSDKPAALLFAGSEAGGKRARQSAELAGCRVIDVVAVEEAVARFGRQAAMDLVVLELDGEAREEAIGLLDALQRLAETGRRPSVVSAPLELVDLVAARTPSPLIQHLCGADEMERVAAIASAALPRRHRLHDASKERGLPRLEQVSQEVARIAATLAALAEKEGRAERLDASASLEEPQKVDAGMVRAMIRARRLRDHYFRSDLFADPAWDILLDLFAARLEGQKVAVSSLCIAAAVPATTALRWIKTLTDMGILLRAADPQDGRRVYIELSAEAAAGLGAYLTAAQRISPLIL